MISSGPARITTGMRSDPNFVANMRRFQGEQPTERDEMYKNYRAFYGGATPALNRANYMGDQAHEQQKTLLRSKLAQNAQRILDTKSFENPKADAWLANRRQMAKMSQEEVLKQSGFAASDNLSLKKKTIYNEEPASYGVFENTGAANFTYARNKAIDKVTKTDPPLKNLQKGTRYNIITGNIQDWY